MAQLSELILQSKDLVQSAYLLLDAAGSDGSDGSARGIHLRWDLLRTLDVHMPKGNLAAPGAPYAANETYIGFNKPDDYIQIFRTPYIRKFPAIVDFMQDKPVNIIESGGVRSWDFIVTLDNIEHTAVSTTLRVTFNDVAEYDRVRGIYKADSQTQSFISIYKGVLQVEALDKLSFVAHIKVKQDVPAAAVTRVEAVSVKENFPNAEQFLSLRHTYPFNSADRLPEPADIPLVDDTAILQTYCIDEYEIMAENIKYIRFDYQNAYPIEIRLETYFDFITGVSGLENPWQSVGSNDGNFSLSVTDSEIFSRLEVPGVYDVDEQWPRFYPDGANPSAGSYALKVNIDNYKSKWNRGGGIKEGVITYLNNSKDGGNASVLINETMDVNADDDLQGGTVTVSYLELLQIVSLDYHIARMLGLGHIDTNDLTAQSVNRKFIYLSTYTTYKALEPGQANEERTHFYMTLPTGQKDFKKPVTPDLYITKGLKYDQGVQEPIMMSDDEGYVNDQRLRFINLNVNRQELLLKLQPFFFQPNNFSFTHTAETVFYGLEYRGEDAPGVWEPYYRIPKIHSDNEFFDHSGNKEVAPLLNAEQPAIYTHQEREEGNHEYASYGVSWFSRPSLLSPPVSINTAFVETFRLLPPVNLGAQLIQEEDPLIFTSTIEQNKLNALINDPGVTDPTLVRVTFDINDVHHQNHQVINKVQFFFKQNEPRNIAGLIKTSTNLPGKISMVTTKEYAVASVEDGGYVYPIISSADTAVFIGGTMATVDQQFFIQDIIPDPSNGNFAKITVEQIENNAAQETPEGSNIFTPVQTFITPTAGDKFFVAENLQNLNNWDLQLSKEIEVINFSPATITISNSGSGNNGNYTVLTAKHNGRNTDIYVKETLPSATIDGDLTYLRKVPGVNMDQANRILSVKGEIVEDIQVGTQIILGESLGSNGTYTVAAVTGDDTNTKITVQETLPAYVTQFSVSYYKTLAVSGLHQTNKIFQVNADILSELQLVHTEVEYTGDGNASVEFIGGIVAEATITAIPDVTDPSGDRPSGGGVPIPGSQSGLFYLTFTSYNLADHPDADVEWYKGMVRVPVTDPASRELKMLEVVGITRATVPDTSTEVGATVNPLQIMVFDPTYNDDAYPKILDPVPGLNPGDPEPSRTVTVNYHPGYRLYLRNQSGFDKTTLLPGTGQSSKVTYFTARSVDTFHSATSNVSQPASIYARKITPPVAPGIPTGPLFATRPDYYGKSTYTFDVNVDTNNRTPFALVFYRANTRIVLDNIYKAETVQQVLQDLAALTSPDADFFTDRWNDLVNGNIGGDGLFKTYTPGGYRFPNPDNHELLLPNEIDPVKLPPFAPFAADGSTTPGSALPEYKRAVELAFVSMTERPVEYEAINDEVKNGGRVTRNSKPVIRDRNGNMLFPGNASYDPAPMAVKYSDGTSKVRFTDYTLEGSSNEVYFYYGVEMSNDLKFSPRSPIAGPIKLVDAYPAIPPNIKSVLTQLANPIDNIPTAVRFEVDTYLSGERIKKYALYRANNRTDSLSVRTMTPVKEYVIDENAAVDVVELVDDFVNDEFPLYGDPLFYRVVALREITNERNALEFIPSIPSNPVLTNVVDVFNPEAPDITYDAIELTDFPRRLSSVVLSWNKTAYNATYYLFKMSTSGNYAKIATIKSNDEVISYALPDDLIKVDENGNEIYHRFKVDVENSSGLLNLTSKEITI